MSLHAEDRDPSVSPGDDFYRFANGGWLDANPIPAGYGSWGSFEELQTRNEVILRELLERAADAPETDLDQILGDHFAAGLDLDAIEAAGTSAIDGLLARIAAIQTHQDVLDLLPALHSEAICVFFGWEVTVDHDDSSRNLLWLADTGLGLPDRDSYTNDDEASVSLRAAYVDHVGAQLVQSGARSSADGDAGASGTQVLELETRLAAVHLKAEEKRDPGLTLNRHDLAQLTELAPGLDLPGYLRAVGAGAAETVNVMNPPAFAALHGIITATDVAALRAYLSFHVVRTVADALPKAFDDEAFAFYGKRIRGQQEQHARIKRVTDAITSDMGEALSQRFVDQTFSPAAKERAQAMTQAIIAELRHSLETRTWMSDETRARALVKLDAITVKIGYPDRWQDWSGLEVSRTTYCANRLAATRHELARQLAKIDQPVDETEWEMPPHIVNAYYHPLRNEIVLPAGILQPPMFDAEADDAVNFGGIGAVIAHELTHGFDDQGRRFDADGAFRDWWTPEDEEHFNALASQLVAQFEAYTVLGDVHINGRLTLGENIADLGGVALSQRALARVSEGVEPIDGLTPAQRFFLANATVWRANVSEELQRTLAQVDPHSPRHLRVVGPFSNLDAFRDAFDLPDDAPMLRPAQERIEIW